MDFLVSVIIPIYNVEKFLDKCIESIVNQTYKNLEIILVDDESPDCCPQKCDWWAENDPRIKVIHQKNSGPGQARNSGLDIAVGEYITFVDPDDYLSADAVESMVNQIIKDQSDLVVAKIIKVYSDGSTEEARHAMNNMLINKNEVMAMIGSIKNPFSVSLCGKLYKKYLFNNIRINSLQSGEDACIIPHVIENCNKISVIDKVVYFYFQRSSSIVHSRTKKQKIDDFLAALYVARFLMEHNCLEGARRYYNSAICQYLKMDCDKKVLQLIKTSFSSKERKILRKGRDINTLLSFIFCRFPFFHNFLKFVKSLFIKK